MCVIACLGCSTGNPGFCFQGFGVKALALCRPALRVLQMPLQKAEAEGDNLPLLMVDKPRVFHQRSGARGALCCPSTTGETLLLVEARTGGGVKYRPTKLTFLYSALRNQNPKKLLSPCS